MHPYRRTPLPRQAQTPVAWVAFCFVALLASFPAGFALHGRVETPGIVLGLRLALFPLAGLAFTAIRHWYFWRKLPPDIASEWKHGRVVPPAGANAVEPPLRFTEAQCWVQVLQDGISISRTALLRMQFVADFQARTWAADEAGQTFVSWAEIKEWSVHLDSDGPDFYALRLRPKGSMVIRRMGAGTPRERELLDAVRSVGKVPVRVLCDLTFE